MSLENWATNRWLEKLGSDREEIERLLANADGHLGDYGLVAQGEADLAGKLVAEVRRDVEDWIRSKHADKSP
jgi:hypothetical protein